jgi:pimeloyl-ACP methyl ester carboxylesterase/V8-like Glu-specific endopeptidase
MADSESLRTYYLRRLMEDAPKAFLESSPLFQESTPSAELTESALRATDAVREGIPLSEEHQSIMEAIVVPFLRPVYDIQNDSFPELPDPWGALNKQSQEINNAIRSIGRLEVGGLPGVPYGGTGFLVGPKLILTNRHVAELVTSSLGNVNLRFIPGRTASLDLRQEVIPSSPIPLSVRIIKMVHPYWDAALLEVDGVPADRKPLSLASSAPSNLAKRLVAVVGYPALDSRGDIPTQLKMFHSVFQKKRLLPGYTMGSRQIGSYGHTVEALTHDCSTLGGNSGSAVIDPETGLVLGLHFAGIELEANFAVPAWELALDSRVVDTGVQFDPAASPESQPAVDAAWNSIPGVVISAPRETVTGVRYPADWFERASTEDLVQALATNRDAAESAIRATLTPGHADQLIQELTPPAAGAATAEGLLDLFDPPPDPDLPEIVWLHGILGGHLARPNFLRSRVWLNPLELAAGNVATGLTLQSDGVASADGRRLDPDGMLQIFYGGAERAWRKQRFVVHDFSYDWRLSIEQLADKLHLSLQALTQDRPNRRFLIVAHSMGGLVASIYAERHPEWRDVVQRAIFMGTPLGGSYAPLQAFIGTYDFLQKLAMISPRVSPIDLRRMAVTLPGLIDMLPNPAQFPDASASYTTIVWPKDIDPPMQRWLDHSRNLKPAIAGSPLLERTTLLVSLGHPTVATAVMTNGVIHNGPAIGAGDGTVPARAAVINGLPAFHVTLDHASIPKDPLAIQAVIDLGKTGQCSLKSVEPGDLDRTFAPPESVVFQEGVALGIRERFDRGQLKETDMEWLFRPGIGLPPE